MSEVNNEGVPLSKHELMRGKKLPMQCPHTNCGSQNIVVNHSSCGHVDKSHEIMVRCETCGGTWWEDYKLMGLRNE